MILGILISLIALDVVIVGAMFFLNRKQSVQSDLLNEMMDERGVLSEMRAEIKDEVEDALSRIKKISDQVKVIATEIEIEASSESNSVHLELQTAMVEFEKKFEQPTKLLEQKQRFIEQFVAKMQAEKILFQKLIQRAEILTKVLDSKMTVQTVLDEIEDKKIYDVRSLLVRGIKHERIAKELGMTEVEVRAIASLSGDF